MKKRILTIICVAAMIFCGTACGAPATSNETISEATILSGGDLLISSRVLEGAEGSDGTWEFDRIFQSVKDIVSDADYAVLNLETSFGGKELGYSGFPKFNTPEEAITAAKDAGFDMLLTASNHSYDIGYDALINKLDILESEGLDYVGTRKNTEDPLHKVIVVNDIKIGVLNYTQETGSSTKEEPILNATGTGPNGSYEYVVVDEKARPLIASYNKKHLDEFYETLETDVETLRAEGAEVIFAYPHWGSEYNIDYNDLEDEIAQKMCDLGIDAIIGGHPHVVEPVKVYTSDISDKTTICLHSMGNFVSSMRNTDDKDNANYVEDGVLFQLTVSKYTDGTCAVTLAEAIPTWVKKTADKHEYEVIPLNGEERYSSDASSEYQSYQRTVGLVADGIETFNGMAKVVMQPVDTETKPGTWVEFQCDAIGTDLEYQWQYSEDGGETWTDADFEGSQSALAKEKAEEGFDGRYYRCKISNAYGTVYTTEVKLTVQ